MTMNSETLRLGYDLQMWQHYGIKEPITIDISKHANSHILLCGMSGSGKSYAELSFVARLALAAPDGEFYFADYKQEDDFIVFRECPRYHGYKRTIEALDIVYDRLQARQAGEDETRHAVTLVWDEYVSDMLSLQSRDKKRAQTVMNKVAEILMLGRSLKIRLVTSCQRPDAAVFPAGSRLNYGVVMILGTASKSTYEMLLPDHMEQVKDRQFDRGEGVLLLQGSRLGFIKIPTVADMEKMREICKNALT